MRRGVLDFDATEALLTRRIAILVDGRVHSAPSVKSRIAGGHLTITIGNDTREMERVRAEALVKALGGIARRFRPERA